MKKVFLLLLAAVMAFAMTGCVLIEYSLKFNEDLSGSSTMKLLTFGAIPKHELEKKLKQNGITSFSISDITEEFEIEKGKKGPVPGLKINLSWKTPEEFKKGLDVFHSSRDAITKNDDGTVTIYLGVAPETSAIKVEVEGKIVSVDPSGRQHGNSTVVFPPRATAKLTFKPGAGFPFGIVGAAAALILAGVGAFLFMKKRKQSSANATSAVATHAGDSERNQGGV